ncbi:hypothetical protein BVX97_04520, partial [bacterium E08(2017)]
LGYVDLYVNTGTDESPVFDSAGESIYSAGYDYKATVEIVDWNNDGTNDLLVGRKDPYISDPNSPGNLLDGTNLLATGSYSHPVVFDWNRDGKKDLLIGNSVGNIRFYRNVGTDASPLFDGYENLMAGGTIIDVGSQARPEIVDWDGDGYADLLVGGRDGKVLLFRAIPLVNLAIPAAIEGDGFLSNYGSVSLRSPATSNIVVTLNSQDTSELTVPSSVTITEGNTNAFFDLTIIEDSDLDGSQAAVVTAEAGLSLGTHRSRATVHDNEATTITVDIPASTTEGAGALPGQGRVTLGLAPDTDIVVSLASDDTSELTTDDYVIVPAGQSTAAFDLTVIDDTEIDYTQSATITAHVENWTDGLDSIIVNDNENTNLVVNIPSLIGEGDGVITAAGKVSISGTLPFPLAVTLGSDDLSELTVPATVIIPAGSTSNLFELTVLDDSDSDGVQVVNVTASSAGFILDSDSTVVADNEIDHFTFSAIATNQIASVPFNITITARDINADAGWYQGSASLTGTGNSGSLPVQPATLAFSNGIWSGSASIEAVDAGVTLSVSDGSGHNGTSTTFDIEPGSDPVIFEWDTIPSPQYAGVPIPVKIAARDDNGYLVPSFLDTVDIGGIFASDAEAQIGEGEGVTMSTVYTSYADARSQIIYLKSEIGGAGRIDALALNVSKKPSITMHNWTIRMKHTALDEYPETGASLESNGWTIVYQADETITSTGWVKFEFSTPFIYDGTNNLMIDISHNNTTWGGWGQVKCTGAYGDPTRCVWSYAQYREHGYPLEWAGSYPVIYGSFSVPDLKLSIEQTVAVLPTESGNFSDGQWSGAVAVLNAGTGVVLSAVGAGVSGDTSPFDVIESDIVIFGNGIPVISGDITPDTASGTDFGEVTSSAAHAFTISNLSGSIALDLTGIPHVKLVDPTGFFRLGQDSASPIAPGGTSTFVVVYEPISRGVHSATVTVVSTSAFIPEYSFVVQGVRPDVSQFTTNHSIPYSWLNSYDSSWTNDAEAEVMFDHDGDGYTTWQEYWCGTDPNNSNSLLKIDSIYMQGNSVRVEWQHDNPAAELRPIAIYSCSNLNGGAWEYAGEKNPADGTNTWLDTPAQQLFYRLVVTNTP